MTHTVETRWSDLDPLGHVSHTAVLTYLEEGRDAFLATHGIAPSDYVVGRCAVRFRSEIVRGAEGVTVECAISDLGRSSVTTTERILDRGGAVVVEAEFGLVMWDPEQRGSRRITETERASLARAVETAR